jgi:chemotaxis protein methyltransferase CheR
VTPDDFRALARFVKRRSGIVLGADKRALAASKLKQVTARFGFKSVSELIRELDAPGEALARDVVAALTTNETSFFRDPPVFQHLRAHILPALRRTRGPTRRIRIWCAAAATGQEPYSVAMLCDELAVQAHGCAVEIVASDIAPDAIARARDGLYAAEEIGRGLPDDMRDRYFRRHGNQFEAERVLRDAVRFEVRNLMLPFADLGAFDIIFCRNVLIYFDPPTKQNVLDRMRAALAPDGYLLLGSAETLLGFSGFELAGPGVYIAAQRGAAARRVG